MKSCSGTIDRSCASVIHIVIRQTRYAVRGVCPPYTLSNTVRKQRLFTAVCGRALRVRLRHPDIWLRCGTDTYTLHDLITFACRLGYMRRGVTAKALTRVTRLSFRPRRFSERKAG